MVDKTQEIMDEAGVKYGVVSIDFGRRKNCRRIYKTKSGSNGA